MIYIRTSHGDRIPLTSPTNINIRTNKEPVCTLPHTSLSCSFYFFLKVFGPGGTRTFPLHPTPGTCGILFTSDQKSPMVNIVLIRTAFLLFSGFR